MSTYAFQTSATPTAAPSSTRARTVAAVAAVLFAASFFLTVASVNVPYQASDATLLDWWQDSANLNSGIASEFFAISAAVFFVVLITYLQTIFATSGMTQTTAFVNSMAAAFTATLLVSSALRGVIGQMVQAQDEPLPGIDMLRYTTGLNYTLLGTATMTTLALAIVAMSVIVVRTGVLAPWVGYVGVVCAGVMLTAVAVMMGSLAIPAALLWAICLAVAIWRQPVV